MDIWQFIAAFVLALIAGGGIGVTTINAIHQRSMHKLERKERKEDAEAEEESLRLQERLHEVEQRLLEMKERSDAERVAIRYLLYYQIRQMALNYIADDEVDFDDRRILRDMHTSYHTGLGGNGDLDKLMEAVDQLPLKQK